MDNLVLTAVAGDLDGALCGARLTGFRRQSADRFAIQWERDGKPLSTVVSMHAERPWVGRPAVRISSKQLPQRTFDAQVRQRLVGASVESVRKPSADRWIEFRFSSNSILLLELAVHGANMLLLDATGRIEASLRRRSEAGGRWVAGQLWIAPVPPESLLDPWRLDAEQIDARLDAGATEGESQLDRLRRDFFGVGPEAAALICAEADRSGRSHGELLTARLTALASGELRPVVESEGEPMQLAREGRFDAAEVPLWPWPPSRDPVDGRCWWHGADAAETAGRWYEARDYSLRQAERRRALGRIVQRECSRTARLRQRVEGDLEKFEDPKRFRRWAEAILAGLQQAVRRGDRVQVPDPTAADGADLLIPADPSVALTRVAERLFAKHRRALRGIERVRERLDTLSRRAAALDRLHLEIEDPATDSQRLMEGMKALHLPVGLEPETRAGKRDAARRAPRMEGVRVYYASTGEMILAGKGAKENHRLTFQLAAPHDFWLHASGVSGAHVVLRNETRAARPAPALLVEAAGVAAYHSESRREGAADVQWTLRKNVRKPRSAARGVVVLKRFETIRVRPALPGESA